MLWRSKTCPNSIFIQKKVEKCANFLAKCFTRNIFYQFGKIFLMACRWLKSVSTFEGYQTLKRRSQAKVGVFRQKCVEIYSNWLVQVASQKMSDALVCYTYLLFYIAIMIDCVYFCLWFLKICPHQRHSTTTLHNVYFSSFPRRLHTHLLKLKIGSIHSNSRFLTVFNFRICQTSHCTRCGKLWACRCLCLQNVNYTHFNCGNKIKWNSVCVAHVISRCVFVKMILNFQLQLFIYSFIRIVIWILTSFNLTFRWNGWVQIENLLNIFSR